jgi:hypothetical protein
VRRYLPPKEMIAIMSDGMLSVIQKRVRGLLKKMWESTSQFQAAFSKKA